MFPTTRLFVGNLPNGTKEDDLRSAFSGYGDLVSLDLKTKADVDDSKKVFAFVTLSASNYEVESCIKEFTAKDFKGNKLYVTRARESFLERLQRERQEAQNKNVSIQAPYQPKVDANPLKRKISIPNTSPATEQKIKNNTINKVEKLKLNNTKSAQFEYPKQNSSTLNVDNKKNESDKKRLESLKKKRQEFKEKQSIIKSGLVGIDKVTNKKIKFDDDDIEPPKHISEQPSKHKATKMTQALFDNDDDSDDEVNFNIKEHYEGQKGQKVLDLQSRYKSDKRFVLDERFIEDGHEENGDVNGHGEEEEERIDAGTSDEKSKQLSILQDVLGVAVTSRNHEQHPNKKTKARMAMLRFDPLQPEHAKLLAPVDETKQEVKKTKKKKNKDKTQEEETPVPLPVEENKVQVSKEQFYEVSDTLKEVIAQPTTFSLRSLFNQDNVDNTTKDVEQDSGFIPLETKDGKRKNPLDTGDRNPFRYDSSESEGEEEDPSKETTIQPLPQNTTAKAVWKENFFFEETDPRFSEALKFFNSTDDNRDHKERRELKSLVKKRIYNKERKNQMFQKKIGGRKKSFKKSYRPK